MKYYKGFAYLKIFESNGFINNDTIKKLNKCFSKKFVIELYGDLLYVYKFNKEFSYYYNVEFNLFQSIQDDEIVKIIKLERKDDRKCFYKEKNDVLLKAEVHDELGHICLYDKRKDNTIEEIGNYFNKKYLKNIFNFDDKKCCVSVYVNNKRIVNKVL